MTTNKTARNLVDVRIILSALWVARMLTGFVGTIFGNRIHDMLLRTEGFQASAGAITLVLKEEGYEPGYHPTKRHPDKVRRFERAKPNQLWQTDLFTFVLKRQNRRVYMVVFMDDHSRFITGYLPGTRDPASERWTIEQSSLHNWVEAYFPGVGWIRFDPTPGDVANGLHARM